MEDNLSSIENLKKIDLEKKPMDFDPLGSKTKQHKNYIAQKNNISAVHKKTSEFSGITKD